MIAISDFGGSGRQMLLLHGSGGCAGDWKTVAESLVDEFTVVAVDLPGHGRSSPLEPWDFPGVIHALDELNLDNPIVVGMSLGGMVAVHWAASHPQCPTAVSIDGHRSPVTALLNYDGMSLARLRTERERLQAAFDSMLSMFPEQRRLFEDIADAMSRDDVVSALRDLRTPATMVVSTQELPGTADFREIMGAFRRGLLRDLRSAASANRRLLVKPVPLTHAMHLESPAAVASLIREAVRRADDSSRADTGAEPER